MSTIVPEPTDKQHPEARHFCPSCGHRASKAVDRLTSAGTVNTDCLCVHDHIWSVHWLGGDA